MRSKLDPIGGPTLVHCEVCKQPFFNGGSWDWQTKRCGLCAIYCSLEQVVWRLIDQNIERGLAP